MWVNQILGEHKINDRLQMSWGAGYNILKANEPDRKRISLANYDNLLDSDPETHAVFTSNTNFTTQRYFQNIYDDEINARMSFKYKWSDAITMNIGGNARYKQRDFENYRFGYDFINTSLNSLNDINQFFSAENWTVNYNTFVLNPISIENEGETIVELSPYNMPSLPENVYDASLINFSTFLDFEILLNEKLLIVPGLRVEDFKQTVSWDVNNLGSQFNPGEAEAQETLSPEELAKEEHKDFTKHIKK